MRVLLLVDTARAPLTGIGRYVYELANWLPRIESVEQIYYYDWTAGLITKRALEKRALTAPPSSAVHNWTRVWRLMNRVTTSLSHRIDRSNLGARRARLPSGSRLAAHGPAFTLPPGNGPRIVTIADLSVLKYPQFHPLLRVKMIARDIHESIRHADHLLTFSEFTRRELVYELGCDPVRVHAIPLAADSAFVPRDAGAVGPVLARYGLAWRGYCLSVGTIEPRKQIDVMLHAFERIEPALRKRYPLALIGDRGWLSDATHRRIVSLEQRGQARYLGYLPQEDLPLIYSGAAACLYTSIYEGFGLPAVEAMASGVPLIATSVASLPEVCGNGAILVEPGNVDELAEAITRVLTDDVFSAVLTARGRDVTAKLSWERTAKETVEVYRQLFEK